MGTRVDSSTSSYLSAFHYRDYETQPEPQAPKEAEDVVETIQDPDKVRRTRSSTQATNFSRPIRAAAPVSNQALHPSTAEPPVSRIDAGDQYGARIERSLSVSTEGHSRPGSPSSFISSASSHIHPSTIPAPFYFNGSSSSPQPDHELPDEAQDDSDPRQSMDSATSNRSARWKAFFSGHRRSRNSGEAQEQPPDITFSPAAQPSSADAVDVNDVKQRTDRNVRRFSQLEEQAHMLANLELSEKRAAALTAQQQQKERRTDVYGYQNSHPQQQPTYRAPQGHQHERNPSLYSNYSFYDLQSDQASHAGPSRTPTPAAGQSLSHAPRPETPGPVGTFAKMTQSARTLAPDQMLAEPSASDPSALVLQGIEAHEKGHLAQAITYFQRAAQAGSGHGALLFGLSLRHGWGVAATPENEARGFTWLQRAAETVVDDLDSAVQNGQLSGTEQEQAAQAARQELVLSIYELGMCFRRGWGTKKNKPLAINYFELAAKLGDPDAAQELGFMYYQGKGCKRDKKKAAQYYRQAAAAGITTFGMTWIYKDKYF